MTLTIYRSGVAYEVVPIDENTVFTHKLMGEHKIVYSGYVPNPLTVRIGDYIEFRGERFYINAAPTVDRINNFTYLYNITFEGEIYFLYNKLFLDEGQADFSYHGTPNDLLLLLLTNINSIQSGWTITEAEAAEPQTLVFTDDTCRTALSKIAEAFEMEYSLAGKAITLKKSVGIATSLEFEYGRGKGLYNLQRTGIAEKNLVTRVYGFGGRKNIDFDYRDGATRLVFEDRKLEANTALYGIREGAVTFDEIYPQRTGVISAINGADVLEFVDSSLDFNLNDYLIEGTIGKVVFKSGDLSGYQFEIKRYLNGDKKVQFLPFSEENGYTLPNATFKPAIGDTYTFVDIKMPESYVEAAEDLLEAKTLEYLQENSQPRVTYNLEIDEKFVRDNGIELVPGHMVQVLDAALGVDSTIRVSEVTYPIVNPAKINAVISDTIPYTLQERLIAQTIDNNVQVRNVDVSRAELARRTTTRFRQLQDNVFDPDGYFDGTKIKPNSIETLLLSVGAKSQNFGLNGVQISANQDGNPNDFFVNAGQLIHYEIEIEGLGYIWSVSSLYETGLNPATPYFLYARCSRTSLTGSFVLVNAPRITEHEAGFYHFYVGILYATVAGRRDFDFTNGMTFINGDTITTGRIKSLDALNYFDLTEGKFKLGDATHSLDWNVTTAGRLTLKGTLFQSPAGTTFPAPVWRGAWVTATNYYTGDAVTHLGSTFIAIANNISAPPSSTPGSWQLYAQKGTDGADGDDGDAGPGIVYRGVHNASTLYYNNALRRDVVLHVGVYYLFKGTNGTSGAFSAGNWDTFGAQFSSVATNLLLAESANIADWIINGGRIESQNGLTILYGAGGRILLAGASVNGHDGTTRLTPEGVYVSAVGQRVEQPNTSFDANGLPITTTSSGPMAALIGKATGGGSEANPKVGVYGTATGGDLDSHGGLFSSLKTFYAKLAGRIEFAAARSASSLTLGNSNYFLTMINTSAATATLPATPNLGRCVYIKRTDALVTVNGNGIDIRARTTNGASISLANAGETGMFIYDGTHWQWVILYN